MSGAAALATETVSRWLMLDAGDPACNDARDTVEALGREVQQRATQVASALSAPLADVTAHCADGGEIARTLADLRDEVDSLDPSELDAERSWFARTIAMVPGVGSPASRYLKRLESSRSRIVSMVQSLEAGRGVLSRDNVTLRSDQERLHELTTLLDQALDDAQAFDDALVFAIDVELPFGDPRRPLFDDELLDACRRRMRDLEQVRAVNRQGAIAIESVMSNNREMIRGIDRTRELTLGALGVAATAGAARLRNAVALDRIDAVDMATGDLIAETEVRLRTEGSERRRRETDTVVELEALRAAFDEVDAALNEIDGRRREALPVMERTVRDVTSVTRQETR